MATSGVTVNQLTRNQFVEAALRTLGVLAIDQTPTSTEYTNAQIKLNAFLGELRALGVQLWARTTYSFSPTLSATTYNIGTGQTLNTPYPIHMLQAYRTDSSNTTRIPMEIIPNFNFNLFPATPGGRPIQLSYQPKINLGVISLWPTPDADAVTNSTVNIVYQRPFEYFSASTDTLDLPEEWVSPIIYGLAVRMAPEYGVPLEDRKVLAGEAEMMKQNALSNGTEDGSMFMQPNWDGRQ